MKGFANETACMDRVLICHVYIYLKLSIEQNHIKVSLYCHKNCFVMYRLFCPHAMSVCFLGSRPRLDVPSDWRPGGCGFNPSRGRQHSFMEIDREIFSTVILSLPLIQEGQLSVSGERMCTILVSR